MRIDVSNVEVENEERVYIKREGEITLKAVKVTEHTSTGGHPAFKVHWQDRAGQWAIDEFVVTENALWKIKMLTKALKLPNVLDTHLIPSRYAKATFKAKGTQNGGQIFEIKKYEPSNLTNTYEPPRQQPQAQYQDAGGNSMTQQQYQQYQQHQQSQQQQIDIDEDEIPF